MPITIPPSVAYQAALIPVTARWNVMPPEGPKFIPAEVDWGVTVPIGQAVAFSLNAGPVEFSQIVAFSVDNGRNGGDVSFIFPDTGRQLSVPAFAQGVFPVFTNSLTFYVISENSLAGDITEFEILNTMPPPVSVLPSQEQSNVSTPATGLNVNGSTPAIPAGITGTLQGYEITLNLPTTGQATVSLVDGAGHTLMSHVFAASAASQTLALTQSNLRLRFTNGVNLVVSASTMPSGNCTANLFYSVP